MNGQKVTWVKLRCDVYKFHEGNFVKMFHRKRKIEVEIWGTFVEGLATEVYCLYGTTENYKILKSP